MKLRCINFKYQKSTSVEYKMLRHTSNHWGATGIVTKGLKIYLETIPGKHLVDSLQKQLY